MSFDGLTAEETREEDGMKRTISGLSRNFKALV